MIKAIIFDVGKVYLKGNVADFVNNSHKILGINKKFNSNKKVILDLDLNRGRKSLEECFRKFFQVPISKKQMKEIKEIWLTTWAPTKEMTELISKLKKNYKLAILSNSEKNHTVRFNKLGWYSQFDVLVLSHELGIIKPEKRIYEMTLERIGVVARECVFIDDQEDHLIPAKELGMKTILFKSINQLKKELKALSVKFD
ncbi:MAG: HAD family phosphatase [Candidatus Woesearchaeota archaeon]|nr:MAG: HAD family phosphatase [Candidatus Woesearchaeota archaeon]